MSWSTFNHWNRWGWTTQKDWQLMVYMSHVALSLYYYDLFPRASLLINSLHKKLCFPPELRKRGNYHDWHGH
jgi:hypothetical protein